MLLGIAAFQAVVFTYFVVSSELLLRWNPHQAGGDVWGFGQVGSRSDTCILFEVFVLKQHLFCLSRYWL